VIEAAPVSETNIDSCFDEAFCEKDKSLHLIKNQGINMSKLTALQEYLCREWYEEWPELQWISKVFVPNIINCISKISSKDSDKVRNIGKTFLFLILIAF